ncbi:MAG: SAM-dependent methyltransferase [Verrucomicrobiaceae bacterium]|nr:SAM-dependent methyltransferase [Verrucomicrobiaceae bacterium]
MPDPSSNPLIPDITVSCKNSQGTVITANVLRLRRYSVSFEVYNPYSILQLSEVLGDFRIRVSGRLVYNGRAVVSGIVNTGFVLVCEVTLGGAWLDVDLLSDRDGSKPLASQFESFLDDWKKAHEVDAGFKVTVADMQNTLVGLQRWLEQIDLGIRSSSAATRESLEMDVIGSMQGRLLAEIHPLMMRLEEMTSNLPEEGRPTHKFYIRRQIQPLVLCSPFTYRTFHKPLGYAGDYEMVNMMLRSPFEGSSLFAKIINYAFLEAPPVVAHRNRITYLVQMLRGEAMRVAQQGQRCQILNLGCGPAQEVQNMLRNEDVTDLCEWHLLDFNDETLQFARNELEELRNRFGRATRLNFLQRSVNQLLKQASTGDADMKWESYDVVYCAGLFDYLSQRVCARLVEIFFKMLKPGGLLVVTNVADTNPSKAWMEYVLEWNLIYRSSAEMTALVPKTTVPLHAELKHDTTGVNLFLEIRKGDGN